VFIYFLALHEQEGKLQNIAPYKGCTEVRHFMHDVTILPSALTFLIFFKTNTRYVQQHSTGHKAHVLLS